jgi:hypothetical protein
VGAVTAHARALGRAVARIGMAGVARQAGADVRARERAWCPDARTRPEENTADRDGGAGERGQRDATDAERLAWGLAAAPIPCAHRGTVATTA